MVFLCFLDPLGVLYKQCKIKKITYGVLGSKIGKKRYVEFICEDVFGKDLSFDIIEKGKLFTKKLNCFLQKKFKGSICA